MYNTFYLQVRILEDMVSSDNNLQDPALHPSRWGYSLTTMSPFRELSERSKQSSNQIDFKALLEVKENPNPYTMWINALR